MEISLGRTAAISSNKSQVFHVRWASTHSTARSHWDSLRLDNLVSKIQFRSDPSVKSPGIASDRHGRWKTHQNGCRPSPRARIYGSWSRYRDHDKHMTDIIDNTKFQGVPESKNHSHLFVSLISILPWKSVVSHPLSGSFKLCTILPVSWVKSA